MCCHNIYSEHYGVPYPVVTERGERINQATIEGFNEMVVLYLGLNRLVKNKQTCEITLYLKGDFVSLVCK